MTIDEAIKHAEKVAEVQEEAAKEWHENQVRKCELIPFAEMDYTHENECKECADEHRQLAEWLKELKQLKEQEPMLDKIRAEIEEEYGYCNICEYEDYDCEDNDISEYRYVASVKDILQIIDKYKAESEVD